MVEIHSVGLPEFLPEELLRSTCPEFLSGQRHLGVTLFVQWQFRHKMSGSLFPSLRLICACFLQLLRRNQKPAYFFFPWSPGAFIGYVFILISLIHFPQGNNVHFQSINFISETFSPVKPGYLCSLYASLRSLGWHRLCVWCITFVCGLLHLCLNSASSPSSWTLTLTALTVFGTVLGPWFSLRYFFFPSPFLLTSARTSFPPRCVYFCPWALPLDRKSVV